MLAPTRRRPCRHDDVLSLVLTHMEAENKVSLRRVYASVLPPYIDRWDRERTGTLVLP